MSLKFLLEVQMMILLFCNSVLMQSLATSALSFSISFDYEIRSGSVAWILTDTE